MGEAELIDPQVEMEQATKKRQARRRLWKRCLYLVLGVILGVIYGGKDDDPTLVLRSEYPSSAPSAAPSSVLDLLLDELPNKTVASLQIPNTPQWKAHEWLSRYPNIAGISMWRKKQLFALVTFYHAFNGKNWPFGFNGTG